MNIRQIERHGRVIFFAGLFVCLLVCEFYVASLSDVGNVWHTVLRVLTPVVELFLAGLACAWCMRRLQYSGSKWWILPCALVGLLYCVVYIVQCTSLYLSNNYLSALGLENTDSESVLPIGLVVVTIAIIAVWTGFFVTGLLRRGLSDRESTLLGVEKWSWARFAIAFVVLLGLNVSMFAVPSRAAKLEPGYSHPPMISLAKTVITMFGPYKQNEWAAAAKAGIGNGTEYGVTCFHFPKAAVVPGYPFEKTWVYKNPLPFPPVGKQVAKPNLIVIFTEGESARLIGAYGGKYPGLTPNIDRLAMKSMKVVNYFNHTAATFRGIIGQTSSGYSFLGGGQKGGWAEGGALKLATIKRQTIPKILNADGYKTYFFDVEGKASPFTTMLKSLGFGTVYTSQMIGNGLLHGKFNTLTRPTELDDQSLFAGLTAFLRRRATLENGQPFFIGIYNMGTHAFLDTNKNGTVYRNGKHEALNTLHNYDLALGSFLDYFYNSPYAKNTVLMFTSDHAKYPDKPYIEVAGPNLKRYFVDRVPLLIWDPMRRLPKTFNAKGRNSLALAPTALQLLGVQHADNSFLGHSLFEPRNFPDGLTALGDHFYLTTSGGVFASSKVPPNLVRTYWCESDLVRMFYNVEAKNRIFHPEGATLH